MKKHALFLFVAIACSNNLMGIALPNKDELMHICDYSSKRDVYTKLNRINKFCYKTISGESSYTTWMEGRPFEITITPKKLDTEHFCSWLKRIVHPLNIIISLSNVIYKEAHEKTLFALQLLKNANVISLTIRHTAGSIDDAIVKAIPQSVQTLTLAKGKIEDPASLQHLQKLQSLNLSNIKFSWEHLPTLQSLHTLSLITSYPSKINEKSNLTLLQTMKSLKSLTVLNTSLPDQIFQNLPKTLECLTIQRPHFLTTNGLMHLANLSKLKKLSIADNAGHTMQLGEEMVTNNVVKILPTSLKEIKITNNSLISGKWLERLTNLESLSLWDTANVIDNTFPSLTNLPLKQVCLSTFAPFQEFQITDKVIEKLPTTITKLSFHKSLRITGNGLEKLTNLEKLNLTQTSITPKNLKGLITKLQKIKQIKITMVPLRIITNAACEKEKVVMLKILKKANIENKFD